MTLPVVFTANGQTGYNLTKSLRFRRSASAYLNRTPASASNRRTWTWSGWVKLGSLSVTRQFFGTTANSTQDALVFNADNQLVVFSENASQTLLRTAQLFRDPAAWYHVVVAVDTTQATSSNRVKIYVNGVQVTAFEYTQYPSQNFQGSINNNVIHYISTYDGSTWAFDGYMDEINFIDGQALTPNSFGTFNGLGVWQPIRYGGSYGTNGFYLPFTNTTSTSTLGNDFSGNSNTWTVNNISLTAGSTYDSMNDVPTLTSATVANYCVMNPLVRTTNNSGSITQADGNLSSTIGSYANTALATIGVTSGKWYWEMTPTATNNGAYFYIGIAALGFNNAAQPSSDPLQWAYYAFNGNKNNNNNVAYGASYTTNDVIGVALDMDTGTLTFYKNNTSQGVAYSSGLTGYTMFPMCSFGNTGSITVVSNFGQRPFAYTPPTGFVALNTFNLPTPTIGATASSQANKYMDVSLYTGNGSTQSITGVGFQPDWVWLKARSAAFGHGLFDVLRGTTKRLSSDGTGAEGTESGVTAFNSDGFTIGSATFGNNNGTTMVGWQWKANGTGVTNTAGSITSTVSANTTAGFSIVTYTGNGSNSTVGHGLGVAPSMVIVKQRNTAQSWCVWHTSIGSANVLFLNSTSASTSYPTLFNSMSTLNSTVFSIGTDIGTNQNTGTYVAYCFAPIAGYSAFGSYTGNGSTDGPFIFTGFRPRYVLIKTSSAGTNGWQIRDTSRSPYNTSLQLLYADTSGAEISSAGNDFDILSNGFKVRNSGGDLNTNGGTYIYACFAENPFKYANAR